MTHDCEWAPVLSWQNTKYKKKAHTHTRRQPSKPKRNNNNNEKKKKQIYTAPTVIFCRPKKNINILPEIVLPGPHTLSPIFYLQPRWSLSVLTLYSMCPLFNSHNSILIPWAQTTHKTHGPNTNRCRFPVAIRIKIKMGQRMMGEKGQGMGISHIRITQSANSFKWKCTN